jgi:glycosyltransferase involved in cell wall biosynthesis
MRVLYVGRGLGVHDRRFVAAFAAQPPVGPGWQVGVLALDGSPLVGLAAGAVAVAGVAEQPASGAAVDQVRDAVRRFRPDVVVAGPLQAATLPAVQAGGAPVVAISWAFDLLADATSADQRRAAQAALAGSVALLCDARVVAEAAQALGMPASRITIAPWGVDLGRFRPGGDGSVRQMLGWQDRFVLLSTRNHEPLYRLDTVIEAFASTAYKVPELRLALLGDGSQRAKLESQARSTGVDDLVQFAGAVAPSDLPAWYASADAYVSASQVDGTSVSLIEAMACGLPAVVSDIPGNREWIEPGATGWLFPLGDATEMARALGEAARMPARDRQRMGRAARAIAEERADWRLNSRRISDAVAAAVNR